MAWEPDYVTLNEFKSFLRIDLLDTQDDAELALAITTASRAIDQEANRQFGNTGTPQIRTYTPEYDRHRCRWVIEVDDIQNTSGVTINIDDDNDQVFDVPIDSFRFFPFNSAVNNRAYTMIIVNPDSTNLPVTREGSAQISGVWGWSSIPDVVEQATLLQASRFFERRKAPFGIAGSPEVGSELRLLDRVDPDVAVALKRFKRWWAAR